MPEATRPRLDRLEVPVVIEPEKLPLARVEIVEELPSSPAASIPARNDTTTDGRVDVGAADENVIVAELEEELAAAS